MTTSPKRLLLLTSLLLAFLAGGWWLLQSRGEAQQWPDAPENAESKDKLGLMTSLPLYWPLDADMSAIASGAAETPWQRSVLEMEYDLVPLDTLSPIPALSPDDPDSDPLAGLERLAVIQPRGLAPADNVALDEWVRAGGRLLLVLDPLLTGDYEAALGDPRRPVDSAVIPPVVARWGLKVSVDPDDATMRGITVPEIGTEALPMFVAAPGRIESSGDACRLSGGQTIAVCTVGKGRVTLVADAAMFETQVKTDDMPERAGEPLTSLLALAFD